MAGNWSDPWPLFMGLVFTTATFVIGVQLLVDAVRTARAVEDGASE